MRIHWNNIFALILVLVGAEIAANFLPAMMAFLSSIKDIGPGHSTDEKTIGLIAVGLVGALLVIIVKVLTNPNRK